MRDHDVDGLAIWRDGEWNGYYVYREWREFPEDDAEGYYWIAVRPDDTEVGSYLTRHDAQTACEEES